MKWSQRVLWYIRYYGRVCSSKSVVIKRLHSCETTTRLNFSTNRQVIIHCKNEKCVLHNKITIHKCGYWDKMVCSKHFLFFTVYRGLIDSTRRGYVTEIEIVTKNRMKNAIYGYKNYTCSTIFALALAIMTTMITLKLSYIHAHFPLGLYYQAPLGHL